MMLATGSWHLRRKDVRPKRPKVEILQKGAKMASQQEMFLDASLGNDLEYKSIREVLFFKDMFVIFGWARVEMSFISKNVFAYNIDIYIPMCIHQITQQCI